MTLGFLTACLPHMPLERIAAFASANGFQALELAAWPADSSRDYMARHVSAEAFMRDDAARTREMLDRHGLRISALAYYDNHLHPDDALRSRYHEHLHKVIDAASMLGVGLVGTFIGSRPGTAKENIAAAAPLFREFLKYASDRGVRLMIENCPMPNWLTFGMPGNYAYSPELWDVLFNEIPDPNLGLNFDPSHLFYLGIDHERAAREYASRIFHAHAKDAEMIPEGAYRYGVFSSQVDERGQAGWWRYRMPGKGSIDWASFIRTLAEVGYRGTLSIEHEDPEYEGSEERLMDGLKLSVEHLTHCLRSAEVGDAGRAGPGGAGAATAEPDVRIHDATSGQQTPLEPVDRRDG
ncbi:MAG TPA: sugar phosphate isomerase/epimerase [Rhodothermales bacterium]